MTYQVGSPGGRICPGLPPIAWLTFIGAITTKIHLITGVLVLPQRNPVILAKHLATIDHLTEGRFELGIGAGWLKEEFDALGIPFERRGARVDEYINIMRALWDGQDVSFDGDFKSFNSINCNLTPVNGRIPVIIGGHSLIAARRAALLGDGFFPATGTQADIASIIQIMYREAEKIKRDPNTIEITTGCPEAIPGSKVDPISAIEERITAGIGRVALPINAFTGNIEERIICFGEQVIKQIND